MLRNLALIALFAGLTQAGCRSNDETDFTPVDLSHPVTGDGGTPTGENDLSVTQTYTETKIHDIDLAKKANTPVKVVGAVVTTAYYTYFSDSHTTCNYSVTVQDPACTTPPCGIIIEEEGKKLGGADGSSSDCLALKDQTKLGSVQIGDVVDVTGTTNTFPTGPVTQNSIQIVSVTKTGGTMSITPMVLSSDTDLAGFVTKAKTDTGAGLWEMYEGTLVTLQPASGKLKVTTVESSTPYHFITEPGKAEWDNNYRFIYAAGIDGYGFPALNSEWTSITGVVGTLFGGGIQPRLMSDFVP